ncbi:MAG: hypothetical protein JW996_03630, partial [Candidatus Cloacimonetes bacterium]|nr:hypothetical protein [Candidatus Cloacimonadota bacterium]
MKRKIIIIFLALMVSFILNAHPKIESSGAVIPFTEVRADSAHGFDVLHYHISMAINDAQEYIEGSVAATVLLEENLAVIEYELVGLDVDEVQLNGEPANYTYNGSEISIEIDSVNPGEEFTTVVAYSGNPILCNVPYALGMFFTSSGIYTISDPNASRYWWPCYDHPWDKAETDLEITVRSDWNVATNGVRTEIIDNGDGTKTHFWDGQNQIATYLVSIVTRVLVELIDDYNGIPIHNFVPPNLEDEAEIDLSGLPEMMEIYTNKYGEYPFEKYGNAVTSFSTYGAMEHQTMTTLASYLITGNHTYDVVIAHELSHQWFGDCLTPLTWKDVWLSEGFATYSEAIFIEETQGYQAMLDYVNSNIQSYYLSWAGGSSYTIYDPAYNSLFTPVTYEKAASILHILRAMFGNEMFFQVLQEYFQTFQNGNIITDDFQMICENVSGLDLDQFFQQWIYQPGIPSFEYTYFLDQNNNELMTLVKSSSTSGTEFHVQLPVKIFYQDATDSLLVSAAPDNPIETIVDLSGSEIVEISLDPDNWIINRGKVFHQASINGGYPGNNSALIFWGDFWAEIEIDGFNLYRSDFPEGEYEQVNEEPIVSGFYLDTDLVNDQAYYYKVKAVKNEQFESPLSDWVEVIPQLMEFDQGILVIDETL